MSFSYEVKKELCEKEGLSLCCKKAQTAGLLIFSKSFEAGSIQLTGEYRIIPGLVADRLAELFNIIVEISVPLSRRGTRSLYTLTVPDSGDRTKLLHYFSDPVPFLRRRCCEAAFIAGAFLACGTVTDPNKDYHLEFSAGTEKKAALISECLEKISVESHTVTRKGQKIVYIKGNEAISDLGYMGAHGCYWELVNVVVEKDCRNKANRRFNCDNANISRTANAAAQQLSAIKKLKSAGLLDTLPDKLREIAVLRLENPEASLRELEELLDGSISRSGINHRLKKLEEIAAESL